MDNWHFEYSFDFLGVLGNNKNREVWEENMEGCVFLDLHHLYLW
jgi:hypothetical protein